MKENANVDIMHTLDFLDAIWLELRKRHGDNLNELLEIIKYQEEWWDIYQEFIVKRIRSGKQRKRGRPIRGEEL